MFKENSETILERVKASPLDKLLNKKVIKCVRCNQELNAALLCPNCGCDENGNAWPKEVFIYK